VSDPPGSLRIGSGRQGAGAGGAMADPIYFLRQQDPGWFGGPIRMVCRAQPAQARFRSFVFG